MTLGRSGFATPSRCGTTSRVFSSASTRTDPGRSPAVRPIGDPAVTTCVTWNRPLRTASRAVVTATAPPSLWPTSITSSVGRTPARVMAASTPCSYAPERPTSARSLVERLVTSPVGAGSQDLVPVMSTTTRRVPSAEVDDADVDRAVVRVVVAPRQPPYEVGQRARRAARRPRRCRCRSRARRRARPASPGRRARSRTASPRSSTTSSARAGSWVITAWAARDGSPVCASAAPPAASAPGRSRSPARASCTPVPRVSAARYVAAAARTSPSSRPQRAPSQDNPPTPSRAVTRSASNAAKPTGSSTDETSRAGWTR